METFIAAKTIVFNPETQRIALVQRERAGILWYEPCGGRIEIDFLKKQAETLEECAKREAKEELGMDIYDLNYIGNYSFFWTKRENVCSICIFFSAKTNFSGEFKTIADTDCYPAYPQWVSLDDIVSEKIAIDPRPNGLKDLIVQAVKTFA